jgi:hypothetical protein
VRGADGTERDVYQDADGRQYVVGDQGEMVFGLWLPGAPPAAPREDADATAADAIQADQPDDTPWEQPGSLRRDSESHRGRMLSLLGTVSFGCGVVGVVFAPVGVIGLLVSLWTRVAARRDLDKMKVGTMDAEGMGQTRAALADANLGVVLSGIGVLLGAGLVVTALFLLF